MPTIDSITAALKAKGSEKIRALYARHGIPPDRAWGVSVADIKLVAKTIKGQQSLALALYDTGMMEAMYLAGIVADGAQMSPQQLQKWAEGAIGIPMVAEYTVPWVAVDHPAASALAAKWIESKHEQVACAGWCTFSGLVATQPDSALDLAQIEALFRSIPARIGSAKNRVRYTMNNFVIAAGTYLRPLLAAAKRTAKQLGAVSVDMGDTACSIPLATGAIAKAEAAGRIGRKKKTIRC
ncbi:MAG TPA: DNA alkylation repair protein [Acidobacteriaceae bacterium]|nr:DNA alkylation repair protein [Acidobacteriaceae bacterium]